MRKRRWDKEDETELQNNELRLLGTLYFMLTILSLTYKVK